MSSTYIELLMNVFKATIERTGIDTALVQDITGGNVCAEGNFATPSRMAALAAGFPETTAVNAHLAFKPVSKLLLLFNAASLRLVLALV